MTLGTSWFKFIERPERRLWLLERREIYLRFCKRFKQYKQFLFRLGTKELWVISKLRVSRDNLVQLFSQPHVRKVCRNCWRECCGGDRTRTDYFRREELLFLAVLGFKLPKLNWGFIASEFKAGGPLCLFLTKNGCVLKENRPWLCLTFACSGLRKVLKKEDLSRLEEFEEARVRYGRHLWIW